MDWIPFVGYFAGLCVGVSFLPQIVKTLKTKQTKDLSLGYLSLLNLGIIAWLTYGILINDLPLIIMNGLNFAQTITVLILKIHYG